MRKRRKQRRGKKRKKMKTKVKKLDKSKIELEIEISAQEFENFFNKAITNLGKNIEIPGFRKGKAPKNIVLKKIDPQITLSEATKIAIEQSYFKAISKENLEPISQPKIDILKLARGNPFCFRANFFVLPQIKLPDYKLIASKIKRKKVLINNLEIDEALKWLQKSRPNFTILERSAQKQDFVEIEFSCSQINPVRDSGANRETPSNQISNGVKSGALQKDAFILGKGHLIKGFEEQLIGMKKGEEKKFCVLMPEDYFQKELAGKKLDFSVKMKAVKKVDFPEIDDEFAQTLGQFKDLTALKESVSQGLEKEKKWAEKQRIRNEILEEIEKKCDFEVPKELLDKLDSKNKKEAKKFLILREIAKKENIQVLEQEVKEEVSRILNQYPDINTAQNKIDLDKLRSYTKERLRNEKVLEKLESFAK